MTDLDKPVVRRTAHKVHDRNIVATMSPGGIRLRLERTQQSLAVDWLTLWKWVESAQAAIPPRKK